MKKILSMFLLGLFGFVSFASADYSSNSEITSCDSLVDGGSYVNISNMPEDAYFCLDLSPSGALDEIDIRDVYNNSSIYCVNVPKEAGVYNGNFIVLKSGVSSVDINSCVKSSSLITWSPSSSDVGGGGSEGGSIINGTNIGSGVQNGVNAFLSGFGGLIPLFLMLGLPILIVSIFRNRIRSYIKHIFVVDKPRGDDIANCNLTLNKYGQFEHHIIGQGDHGDYVDIPGVGLVGKDELPYYVDDNLEFKYKEYKQDHTTFDSRDPGSLGDDYYKRSENIEEEAYYYRKYL